MNTQQSSSPYSGGKLREVATDGRDAAAGSYPFQDPDLPVEERIDNILSLLTLDEKVVCLGTDPSVPRLGVVATDRAEGVHGMVMAGPLTGGYVNIPTTTFPQAIGMAQSWDPDLLRQVGGVIGREARHIAHSGKYGLKRLVIQAPVADLNRDPRWGRNDECYGEDAYFNGVLSIAFVRGLQGDDPTYWQAAALLKHFVANSNEDGRLYSSSDFDEQLLRDYYAEPFRAAIVDGGAGSYMAAFNAYNDIPCTVHPMLKSITMGEWGLDGIICTDFLAMTNLVTQHHAYPDLAHAAAASIKAGISQFLDPGYPPAVYDAVAQNLLTESEIDEVLRRNFRVMIRLGLLDPPERVPYTAVDEALDPWDSEHHHSIARLVARKAIVLLKNEAGAAGRPLLPLDKDSGQSVAVVGPYAGRVMLDLYSGQPPYAVSPVEGIRNKIGDRISLAQPSGSASLPGVAASPNPFPPDVAESAGYPMAAPGGGAGPHGVAETTSDSRLSYDMASEGSVYRATSEIQEHVETLTVADIAQAVTLARSSDVVIVCVGNDPACGAGWARSARASEGKEGVDRKSITLEPEQEQLIRDVYAANPNTVVVLLASFPYAINWAQEHVPAILHLAHGSQETGNALADVIFGDYNPAGRLAQTWPRSLEQLPPMMDYDIRHGRTYMYFQGEPLYPFGHGLSYTGFAYSDLRLSGDTLGAEGEVTISVDVTNTGDRDGEEVVQLYVRRPESSAQGPRQELKGFRRVGIAAGETETVTLSLALKDLARWDVERHDFAVEEGKIQVLIGRSSADIELRTTLKVMGDRVGSQLQPAATARASHVAATVAEVRFEHRRETLGLGAEEPRLSWVVETPATGWRQAAYEIHAVGADGQVRGGTGRVASDQSVLVPWPFAPLRSRERLSVRVRVWGTDGSASAWSALYPAEAGLLSPADWTARFVAPGWEEDTSAPQPAPMLRREFDVRSGVTAARLYVTALGVYEARINGETVGDHVLDPGWTSYNHRLRYYTFDVAGLLREGRNAIGAILADGWYRGRLGFGGGRRNIYGDRLALLAQLEISYADGTTQRVVTDESWRAATGPILAGDIYDGETYDARLERPGWSAPGYDDAGWSPVVPLERDLGTLVAPTGPPVRRTEIITPVSVGKSPSGRTLVDFGQNLVGRLRIAVQGEAGTTITLRHAEVLEHGELGVRPLRTAQATDRYTLRGGEPETWEPRFTFHGFRYAEVDGWPGEVMGSAQGAGDEGTGSRGQGTRSESQEPGAGQQSAHDGVMRVQASGAPETALSPAPLSPAPSSLSTQHAALSVSAIVTHSDMERTGWFECSDPLVNRLHENVVWSMRGNFLDIPTDCPQRDERLGWTGDLAAFAPTATFLYDCAGFLQSWLADLAAEQKAAGGLVPQVIPNVLEGMTFAAAAWGDAAAIVPWVLYRRFGDGGILAAQYESMRSWVDLVAGLAGENRLWDEGFQFGDWLDPSAPPEQPWAGRTSAYLVATAYFARSAELVGLAAGVLGRHEDAARYKNLAAEVRAAFAGAYLQADGLMTSDSETAYSLAVEYGLFPTEEQRGRAGERLAELARESDYAISTGFVGTPIVCDALCSVGEMDAAYRLLMRRECPSWLYPVTMGGTTIWERWDSMRPDGSINPGEMTSFNHYALGAVADWLHRVAGGLAPAAPGYRALEVRPRPGGGLTYARARHRTPYGLAECSWRIADGQIEVEVVVPPNTSATVELPGSMAEPIEVGSGKHSWSYRYSSETAPTPGVSP